MANYNKYINTFSGSTDAQEWGAYLSSEYAGFPNVAYLETSDMVKYRKTGTAKEAVGSIYYSDGSMTLPSENVDTTKTPIGIVVIPALSAERFDYTTIIMGLKNTSGKWATNRVDTPLPNISRDYLNASGDTDGRYNTAVLAASGDTYPAAANVLAYSTEGTEAGDWYMPTITEWIIAYSGNTQVINDTITKIRTALGSSYADTLNSYASWSSTEADTTNANAMLYNGNVRLETKTDDYASTRPFYRVP